MFAHHCLQELHIRPSEYLQMGRREKAFVIASIELRAESEKKATEKAKRKGW